MQNREQEILGLLMTKSVMKQDVFFNTIEAFQAFRKLAERIIDFLKKQVTSRDSRITFYFKEFNVHSFQIKVAGDVLQFDMHTNVFKFPPENPLLNTSRVKKDPELSYCGIISVYNFMADSFKYNRSQDTGILAARIFVNREKNLLTEMRYQSGYRMGSFSDSPYTEEMIQGLLYNLIYFAIGHDLTVPSFQQVFQVSVAEVQEKAVSTILRTGKRLGFGTSEQDHFFEDTKL